MITDTSSLITNKIIKDLSPSNLKKTLFRGCKRNDSSLWTVFKKNKDERYPFINEDVKYTLSHNFKNDEIRISGYPDLLNKKDIQKVIKSLIPLEKEWDNMADFFALEAKKSFINKTFLN